MIEPTKFWSGGDYYGSPTMRKHQKKIDKSFEKNHCLSKFFRTTYADLLLNPFVRLIIICSFLCYLVSYLIF